LKTRETSQAMIRPVLGDEILQELGTLPMEFAMRKPAPTCLARRV
jgi:hypothetical protein